MKKKLTSSQAIVKYMINEKIPIVFGILGHGNIQLGEALKEHDDKIKYIQVKNEQNGVHMALGYAKHCGRPLAVTTSTGPGCTNLVTGASTAYVNRLPVLLLPGEAFADATGPLLQQVETNTAVEEMASDTLKPVSKYWVRIMRPEQLMKRLPQAFEAMMEPGNQGPATFALPMDSQAFSYKYDLEVLLKPRYKNWERTLPDERAMEEAANILKKAKRPLIIAGGGVIRSKAWDEVISLAEMIDAPVVSTQAGNGVMLWDHSMNAYVIGPDGSSCGNRMCKKADTVIGIGTRYSDFTTCSETLFAPGVQFININISNFDVGKQRAVKLLGDAKVTLTKLEDVLSENAKVNLKKPEYHHELQEERKIWMREVERATQEESMPMTQSRIIGILNENTSDDAVIVSAAGSLPGHLLRLWKTKDPTRKGYHCEYGYSTMGYEIAGSIGVKLADPEREVITMVGDASFLMAPQALVTAVQESIPITTVVVDNHGPQAIRNLQKSFGFVEFGNEFKYRKGKSLSGKYLDIDYVKIAEGMGVAAMRAETPEEFAIALEKARNINDKPTLIHVLAEPGRKFLSGYDGWWDVPRPEVSNRKEMRKHREEYELMKKTQTIR